MKYLFEMYVKMVMLGWIIAGVGAGVMRFTASELTVTLAIIGCIVPLGVAWITTYNHPRATLKSEGEKLRECQAENARLRKQLRELTK